MTAMTDALRAVAQAKTLARRRNIRARAHNYERALLRPHFNLPEHWFQSRNANDPDISRAIIRKLRVALVRDRRLRGPFLRRTACPLDRETMLWGFLGGELLRMGRDVKTPDEVGAGNG